MDLHKLDMINTELLRSKKAGVNIEDERGYANTARYLGVEEKEIKECVSRLISKPTWVRKMIVESAYFPNPVDAKNFFEDRIPICKTSMVSEFMHRLIRSSNFHRFEFLLDWENDDNLHKSYILTMNVYIIED